MSDVVYLGGVDANALGLSLTALPGAWSAPATPYATLTVPQYDGVRLTRARPDVGARTIELVGLLRNDTAAAAETAVQTLKDAVLQRLVPIRFGFQPSREYRGVCQAFEADLFAPGNLAGWCRVALSFLLPDPWAVDVTPTALGGAAGVRLPVEVGTGPTWAVVRVEGAATTPTLTYRNYAGTVLGTLAYGDSLAAGDALVVDAVRGGEVTRYTAGTASNGLEDTAAGFSFPEFSPRDAVRSASAWPTVETDSGTLTVTYARRWA
jgi:hypothetical protein